MSAGPVSPPVILEVYTEPRVHWEGLAAARPACHVRCIVRACKKPEDPKLIARTSSLASDSAVPECAICLRGIAFAAVGGACMHHFCCACLLQCCSASSAECPKCRSPLTMLHRDPEYDVLTGGDSRRPTDLGSFTVSFELKIGQHAGGAPPATQDARASPMASSTALTMLPTAPPSVPPSVPLSRASCRALCCASCLAPCLAPCRASCRVSSHASCRPV